MEAIKASDLFGDTASSKKSAELFEEYTSELNKSFANASTVPGQAPTANPVAQLEALVANIEIVDISNVISGVKNVQYT